MYSKPDAGDFGVTIGTAGILYSVGSDVIADAFDKDFAALEAVCVFLF